MRFRLKDAAAIDPWLIRKLGLPKPTPNGLEYQFNCPNCINTRHSRGNADEEHKLRVNFRKGKYFCMRCGWGERGFHGSLRYLYRWLGGTYESGVACGIGPRFDKAAKEFLGFATLTEAEASQLTLQESDMTDNWQYSDAGPWVQQRLRSIPVAEIRELMQRCMRRGLNRFFNRVFFLDYYHDELKYWTARTFIEGFEPKYLNPWGVPRYTNIYNRERIEREQPKDIIICEGIISAMVAGPDAIATYGRVTPDAQIAIINGFGASRYFVAFESDPDASKDAWELALALHKYGKRAFMVHLPDGEDPASLGRMIFRSLLVKATEYSWKNHMKWKLLKMKRNK